MAKSSFFILILSFATFFSCSLNYETSNNSENSVPEITFTNVNFEKYKDGKKNTALTAEKLEMYKSDNSMFAKEAKFFVFDYDGKTETEGSCTLIAADGGKERYSLYGGINVTLHKQNMQIFADSLRFNKKNEQLTGSSDGEVRLKKDGLSISGKGFTASGVSHTFSFSAETSGTILTDEEAESEEM